MDLDDDEANLQRIANVLAGECTDCKWTASCTCMLCTRELYDVILYRCPSCLVVASDMHRLANADEYLVGTANGTRYDEKYHWRRVNADGTLGEKLR